MTQHNIYIYIEEGLAFSTLLGVPLSECLLLYLVLAYNKTMDSAFW